MYVYESYFFRKNTFVSIYFPEFIHFFRFFVDLHGLKDIIFQLWLTNGIEKPFVFQYGSAWIFFLWEFSLSILIEIDALSKVVLLKHQISYASWLWIGCTNRKAAFKLEGVISVQVNDPYCFWDNKLLIIQIVLFHIQKSSRVQSVGVASFFFVFLVFTLFNYKRKPDRGNSNHDDKSWGSSPHL